MSDTIFHKILSGELASAKIYEDDFIFAFMDAFPQAKGHALIIGKNGSADLFDMDDEILGHIIKFSKKLARAQREVFQPEGIRVMQFNGAAAGQTVFYYHMHLLPVYKNETLNAHADKAVALDELQQQAELLRIAL